MQLVIIGFIILHYINIYVQVKLEEEKVSDLNNIIFRKSNLISRDELRIAEDMIDNPEYGDNTCIVCSGYKKIDPKDNSTRAIYDLGICSNHTRMELYKKTLSST